MQQNDGTGYDDRAGRSGLVAALATLRAEALPHPQGFVPGRRVVAHLRNSPGPVRVARRVAIETATETGAPPGPERAKMITAQQPDTCLGSNWIDPHDATLAARVALRGVRTSPAEGARAPVR